MLGMKRFVQLAACSLSSLVYAQEPTPSEEGAEPPAEVGVQAVEAATSPEPAPAAPTAPEVLTPSETSQVGERSHAIESSQDGEDSSAVASPANGTNTENQVADSTASTLPGESTSQPSTESTAPPGAASASGEQATLPIEILMASKELALSDTEALARALAELSLSRDQPAHLAVVQRFNGDMQLLATLLSWVGNKEEADLLAAPAGVLCRRGAELVNYFEVQIAPHLSEEQQRELANNITPEQKQALAQVFQTLVRMMQTGFHGSAELSRATAPLLKNMLGVPNP